MPYPDLAAVKAYMGATASTYEDAAIAIALTAETAAQAKRCRVPVTVDEDDVEAPDPTPDLVEALCRRVARNLAMRRLPLGVIADVEMGSTRLGSTDPEIRRLEGPYRKVSVG